jgi:hypothetical protein
MRLRDYKLVAAPAILSRNNLLRARVGILTAIAIQRLHYVLHEVYT